MKLDEPIYTADCQATAVAETLTKIAEKYIFDSIAVLRGH